MTFKKASNTYMFSKYIREDGKYSITATDRKIGKTYKTVFIVRDQNDETIEIFMKLKDAKAKYADA